MTFFPTQNYQKKSFFCVDVQQYAAVLHVPNLLPPCIAQPTSLLRSASVSSPYFGFSLFLGVGWEPQCVTALGSCNPSSVPASFAVIISHFDFLPQHSLQYLHLSLNQNSCLLAELAVHQASVMCSHIYAVLSYSECKITGRVLLTPAVTAWFMAVTGQQVA